MATAWEYRRARAVATEGPENRQGRARRVQEGAEEKWLVVLNELGADGWELIKETFEHEESPDPFGQGWAAYLGTFKRPALMSQSKSAAISSSDQM